MTMHGPMNVKSFPSSNRENGLSVQPHGRTRLPLDGFPFNFISEDYYKTCPENSTFITI